MKKRQLKLSLNKIKIASITNMKKIKGGNGTTVNGQCEDDVMTFNDLSCVAFDSCGPNCYTTIDSKSIQITIQCLG